MLYAALRMCIFFAKNTFKSNFITEHKGGHFTFNVLFILQSSFVAHICMRKHLCFRSYSSASHTVLSRYILITCRKEMQTESVTLLDCVQIKKGTSMIVSKLFGQFTQINHQTCLQLQLCCYFML